MYTKEEVLAVFPALEKDFDGVDEAISKETLKQFMWTTHSCSMNGDLLEVVREFVVAGVLSSDPADYTSPCALFSIGFDLMIDKYFNKGEQSE